MGTLGVTLLELLVVITMIGILSAIAMARLDWRRYQADAAGRGAMAELAAAQRLALSLQANVVVTFPDSTRMRVLEDANNDGAASAGERVRYVVLDNNFYFGKANAPDVPSPETAATFSTLTFHRDGSADKSATLYLHGPGSDPYCRHCRAVAINRATGRVVWYTYATGAWKRAN
jgi:prepilin-type N-terminal cleavage/methylation domain-containing protein